MYINDTFDSILSESLTDSEFRELVKEGAFDGFKDRFVSRIFSRISDSITTRVEDNKAKTDLFTIIRDSKGDIDAYQLYGPNNKFDDIYKILYENPATKQYAKNMKTIYDFLNKHKHSFMKGFKKNNIFLKSVYVTLVSTMTNIGANAICRITKTGNPNIADDEVVKGIMLAINNNVMQMAIQQSEMLARHNAMHMAMHDTHLMHHYHHIHLNSVTLESGASDMLRKTLSVLGLGALVTAGAAGAGLGAVAVGSVAVTAIISFLLYAKVMVFYVYESRIKFSDFLYQNALLLELHKTEVNNNSNLSDDKKEAIVAKQKKLASLLLKVSEKIAVDSVVSKRKSYDLSRVDTTNIIRDSKENASNGTINSDYSDIQI